MVFMFILQIYYILGISDIGNVNEHQNMFKFWLNEPIENTWYA